MTNWAREAPQRHGPSLSYLFGCAVPCWVTCAGLAYTSVALGLHPSLAWLLFFGLFWPMYRLFGARRKDADD